MSGGPEANEPVQCFTLISTYSAAPLPPWRRCKSSQYHLVLLRFAPCHVGKFAGGISAAQHETLH
jgi:hypothetical protein